MQPMPLFILLVNTLLLSIIKQGRFDTHVKDTGERHLSITDLKNDPSGSMDLFGTKEVAETLKYIEKKYGKINFDDIMEQTDRKKVQHILEDEENNMALNKLMCHKSYELLCLKKKSLSADIVNKLKCQYIDRGIPFLKIAPFKEEEAYLEPRIVLFHDVINSEEIEIIKLLAQPELEKATYADEKTGKEVVMDFRVTDTAWLSRNEHEVVETVNRRVELMTGLSLRFAEPLQVAYYPVGGKYEPHHDFYSLTNVEKGGATVFPKLDVSLTPIKGSAAFWYNIKPNGLRDYLTHHAACPVISGSKWAANLWISEENQEFYRPCTLENQPRDKEWERVYLTNQTEL